jgi:hypothetical protein
MNHAVPNPWRKNLMFSRAPCCGGMPSVGLRGDVAPNNPDSSALSLLNGRRMTCRQVFRLANALQFLALNIILNVPQEIQAEDLWRR